MGWGWYARYGCHVSCLACLCEALSMHGHVVGLELQLLGPGMTGGLARRALPS